MKRRGLVVVTAAVLAASLLGGSGLVVRQLFFGPLQISAYFPTATAIYPGDQVRVSGVRVGTIEAIDPDGTQTKLTMSVDHGVPIPADAEAVIVAPNLVAARYVELTPAYHDDGPIMGNQAVIPAERTAVPVEWDQVKAQLMRLATDLGPNSKLSGTSVGRFIDSAANALGGNGDKLRKTLAQLSGAGRILAAGGNSIADVIKNLQTLVTALRDSDTQIVQFENRFATLTSVLDRSKSDLDAALSNLSVAVGDVQRFVAGSRDQTSEQIQRLANVTQNLVENKMAVQNLLHITPNALVNAYNNYNPNTGTLEGGFSLPNFANPIHFFCTALGAIENATAPETAKLCDEYLGPALRVLNLNILPPPVLPPLNPYLQQSPTPENVLYTDPSLAPGGTGSVRPPEPPPAISAYTGLNGDSPPPAGFGQPPAIAPGPTAPDIPGAPAYPAPALYPGAPVPNGSSLPNLLLPAPPANAPPAPVPPTGARP
jgi:phospholipid/cholesterol/gamma-HCH transport system substrate-binding protein